MSLTTTTLSFNLHNIREGYLAIVCDAYGSLIGTGIIINAKPLELTIAMRPVDGSSVPFSSGYDESFEIIAQEIIPYDLRIKFIESGEIQLFVINPDLYSRGDDSAPVHY